MVSWKKYLFFAFSFVSLIRSSYAFDVEQVKKEICIQLSQDLKATPKSDPILLLIGGYPGAGKTTLIQALHQMYDVDVISWNSIRQALLDRHLKGSPHDWEVIEAVNRYLFKTCLGRSVNIAIDANAYANNIRLFENLLQTEQSQNRYRVVKICLNPPPAVLMDRVLAREEREGIHQGTKEDLQRDLKSEYKKINLDDYSLVIKNGDGIDFETELSIVSSFLNPYFNKQSFLY